VVDLSCADKRKRLMQQVPVKEVWGIGSKTSNKLNKLGVKSTWDLACLNESIINAQFSVLLARTVLELNGTPCLPLEEKTAAKQQIICSRSFKPRLTLFDDLAAALTQYASRATEKLRKQHGMTELVSISIRTGLFDPSEKQYQRSLSLALPQPTQDSRDIIKTAKSLLKQIFQEGYHYQHAGISLGKIRAANALIQTDLFSLPSLDCAADNNESSKQTLMESIDKINQRFPKAIAFSTASLSQQWHYQAAHLSPRYTTHWADLKKVSCR